MGGLLLLDITDKQLHSLIVTLPSALSCRRNIFLRHTPEAGGLITHPSRLIVVLVSLDPLQNSVYFAYCL
jgi:hypothetical protein